MFENGRLWASVRVGFGAVAALGLFGGLGVGCDEQADPSYRGESLVTVTGRVESALSVGDVEVGILWLTTESGGGCSEDFAVECTAALTVANEPSACVDACGELSPSCENAEAWEACVDACPDVTSLELNAKPPICITGGVGQTTPALGEFPAQFSLDILEPPPAEALIGSTSGERLAYGLFVALDPAGAPWRIDLTLLPAFPPWLLGGSESHVLLYAPDGIPEGSTYAEALGFTLPPGYQLMENFVEQTDGEEISELRPVLPGEASQVRLTIADPSTLEWLVP